VKEGANRASASEEVRFLKMENGNAVFELGSGNYSFEFRDYRFKGN
jgi:alpha-L-rhamnosidase